MADRISKEQRSKIMSRIRSVNTSLELTFKKLLSENKIKGFMIHPKMLGSPDFAYKKKNIVIFIDGDFWHGYNWKKLGKVPPKKYWQAKIERNIARDKKYTRQLKKEGWKVIRIWEHDINKKTNKCIEKIIKYLNKKEIKLTQTHPKMITSIIFDLDNTLIDFMKMKRISCEEAVDAMIDAGLKIPKKKALDILYGLYKEEGLEDPQIFQKFLKKVTGKIDYRKLSYAIVAYRNARTGFLHPFPGTKRTLIKLKEKGLKLAIVSDAPKLKAWMRLSTMKIDDFFDVVVGLEDTGRTKPSKLPFRAALKELKAKPSECLMVGDRPERDMKGAKAIGMKTCFAMYGFEGKPKGKWDSEIKNIQDLVNVVGKL